MKIDKSQLNLTPLNESIKTLFADDERLAIADEVLSMARENYKRAGGIKGDGVNSPEELVASTKLWKIIRRNNKMIGGILYKDRGGRKGVLMFHDKSDQAKRDIAKLIEDDLRLNRAFYEVSANILAWLNKYFDYKKYLVPSNRVGQMLAGKDVKPIDDFAYNRNIGGQGHPKYMLGNVQQFNKGTYKFR